MRLSTCTCFHVRVFAVLRCWLAKTETTSLLQKLQAEVTDNSVHKPQNCMQPTAASAASTAAVVHTGLAAVYYKIMSLLLAIRVCVSQLNS